MTSIYNLQSRRKHKIHRNKKWALTCCPQKWGIVLRAYTTTPKKPNSGIRKIAKIRLSNLSYIIAHIPGIGHTITEHNTVLVWGGRVRDIPGVKYTIIRGVYDCIPVEHRISSRSKYGVKKPKYIPKTIHI